jgi:hypothetical protein
MTDLNQVLADWREQAAMLSKHGHKEQASSIVQLCDEVADVTEDFRTFISEGDARLRSGWSLSKLRRHFGEWRENGHAEIRGRVRYYRLCIIPTRPDVAAAREAGRRGESAA